MLVVTIFYSMLLFMILYCIYSKNYTGILIGFFMSFIFLLVQDIPGLSSNINTDIENKDIYKHYLTSLLLPIFMLVIFFITILLEHGIKNSAQYKSDNYKEKRKHIITEKEREYLSKVKKESEIKRYFDKGLDCEDELLLVDKITEKEEWSGEIEWIDSDEVNNIFESTYLIKGSNILCTILFYNKKVLIQYHM